MTTSVRNGRLKTSEEYLKLVDALSSEELGRAILKGTIHGYPSWDKFENEVLIALREAGFASVLCGNLIQLAEEGATKDPARSRLHLAIAEKAQISPHK